MTIKDYLLNQDDINSTTLANLMYPTNKTAKTYLSRKLNGTDGRTWTDKDEELARTILHQLGEKLKSL